MIGVGRILRQAGQGGLVLILADAVVVIVVVDDALHRGDEGIALGLGGLQVHLQGVAALGVGPQGETAGHGLGVEVRHVDLAHLLGEDIRQPRVAVGFVAPAVEVQHHVRLVLQHQVAQRGALRRGIGRAAVVAPGAAVHVGLAEVGVHVDAADVAAPEGLGGVALPHAVRVGGGDHHQPGAAHGVRGLKMLDDTVGHVDQQLAVTVPRALKAVHREDAEHRAVIPLRLDDRADQVALLGRRAVDDVGAADAAILAGRFRQRNLVIDGLLQQHQVLQVHLAVEVEVRFPDLLQVADQVHAQQLRVHRVGDIVVVDVAGHRQRAAADQAQTQQKNQETAQFRPHLRSPRGVVFHASRQSDETAEAGVRLCAWLPSVFYQHACHSSTFTQQKYEKGMTKSCRCHAVPLICRPFFPFPSSGLSCFCRGFHRPH